jgi:hypothetical protein
MKLLKCPFCGKNDEDNEYFTSISEQSKDCWSITHFCREVKDELYCCITVYGKTKEEVIELWNRRASQ